MKDIGLEKFSDFYGDFHGQSLEMLSQIYHSDVVFTDPVGQWRGLPALTAYFERSRKGLLHCRFDLLAHVEQGAKVVVEWRMVYAHGKLARGQTLNLEGISVLTREMAIENSYQPSRLIVAQRDYYDLSAMVLEHAPVLGIATRAIKRQLRDF